MSMHYRKLPEVISINLSFYVVAIISTMPSLSYTFVIRNFFTCPLTADRFHAIYWPAFLMAAGLEPPRKILCHSHWLMNKEKVH